MTGLGTVRDNQNTYLSVAGGFIWNRKSPESDPNYATQEFTRADKTIGTRSGARYADLTGKVVAVQFRTHDEYGESINVTVDADGERYIVSISTNNRYSQDMMKALLKGDLSKDFFIKPYDFIGKDKKRAMGISFRQDGEKMNLRNDDAPSKEGEWFKTADKKEIRRFFEDLNDWFVAEVEEKVCSQFTEDLPKQEEKPKAGLGAASDVQTTETEKQEIEEDKAKDRNVTKAPTVLAMKKALKSYIAENYEGEELPKLDKETLKKWYDLSLKEEELPFGDNDVESVKEGEGDLNAQLDVLMDK